MSARSNIERGQENGTHSKDSPVRNESMVQAGNIGQVLIDREATGRTLSPGDLDRWLNETTAPFYTD